MRPFAVASRRDWGGGAGFLRGHGLRVGNGIRRRAEKSVDATADERRVSGVERGEHGDGAIGFGEVEGGGHVASRIG